MTDYVLIHLNDTTTSLCFSVDDPGVINWLKNLPENIPVTVTPVEDSGRNLYAITISTIALKRTRGFLWGAFEGAATGVAVGSNVSGAGLWLVGAVCQFFGSLAGFLIGMPVFAILGLMSDANTIRDLMTDYRHAFGKRKF